MDHVALTSAELTKLGELLLDALPLVRYGWRIKDWLQNGPEKHDLDSPKSVNSSLSGFANSIGNPFRTVQ